MKCRHYNQVVPGCRYCDSIIESERQERAEQERAVAVETLEGRLACEAALVDTLRAEIDRLRAALEAVEPMLATHHARCPDVGDVCHAHAIVQAALTGKEG